MITTCEGCGREFEAATAKKRFCPICLKQKQTAKVINWKKKNKLVMIPVKKSSRDKLADLAANEGITAHDMLEIILNNF